MPAMYHSEINELIWKHDWVYVDHKVNQLCYWHYKSSSESSLSAAPLAPGGPIVLQDAEHKKCFGGKTDGAEMFCSP